MILEGVRDHIVPKLHGKDTPFQMWKDLTDIFEISRDARKLALMNKLRIEDKYYDVAFNNGKVCLKHFSSIQVKQIGVRIEILYKLEVGACASLSSKAYLAQGRDVGDLQKILMGRLHHGALKILKLITIGPPKSTLEQHDVCKECTLRKYAKSNFQG